MTAKIPGKLKVLKAQTIILTEYPLCYVCKLTTELKPKFDPTNMIPGMHIDIYRMIAYPFITVVGNKLHVNVNFKVFFRVVFL